MIKETKKTNCHFCGYLCGFNAVIEDGRVVDLQPDPSRYPYDTSILAGCRRWRTNIDFLDSPDRVNFPLKRQGDRGSGDWERISWDEALDTIASRLDNLRLKYGSGVLASMIGGPHTSFWPLHRFMSLFGSPNNMGIGQICWNPRIWMDVLTFGWTIEADITPQTNTLFIWGTNPAESDNSVFWRTLLKMSKSPSPKIYCIDPRYTRTAGVADVWVPLKPGSDCAFALALINVIISEGLFDRAFVDEWCYGFDELAGHVEAFSAEVVSKICGIESDLIYECARDFANSPSAIVSGRGIDQVGRNVAPTHRARCCLLAITGNVDRPGSCVLAESSDFVEELDLEATLDKFDVLNKLCLNTDYTPLQSYEGYSYVNSLTSKLGRRLPARYLTSAHPDLVLHAMETGEPYPIRALVVEATNPLLTYADTNRVYSALMSLDLIVVLDYFMTPTAQIADFVLPAAGAIERPTFQAHGGVANMVYGGPAACRPYYERKGDYEIFRELGLRLGQSDMWPWETFEDACAYTLKRAGMTWEQYCETGMYFKQPSYFKHEILNGEGERQGFATSTGKIELASVALDALGGDRLPRPGDPFVLCDKEFVCAELKDSPAKAPHLPNLHLGLITGGRKQPYNASMYLNNASFRRKYPRPVVEMSANTARDLDVCAGDAVELWTSRGKAVFEASVIEMRDGLLHADYGWWHPERGLDPQGLGGIFESNVNALTSCSLEGAEPMIGTWSYNNIDCMARKFDGDFLWPDEI